MGRAPERRQRSGGGQDQLRHRERDARSERSGSVIYYASEDEAARNLKASGGSGPKGAIELKGRVLFTPFGAQATGGRTAQESRGVVEGCVTRGEAAAADDDGDKKKRKKKR